jgi:hypothetical protein
MRPGRSWEPQRLIRHDNPRNRIRQQTYSGHQGDEQPNQPYQGNVQVKVLRQSRAHPRNLPVHTWTYQTLSCRYRAHSYATVRANIGVVLNHLSAIVAVQGLPPGCLMLIA